MNQHNFKNLNEVKKIKKVKKVGKAKGVLIDSLRLFSLFFLSFLFFLPIYLILGYEVSLASSSDISNKKNKTSQNELFGDAKRPNYMASETITPEMVNQKAHEIIERNATSTQAPTQSHTGQWIDNQAQAKSTAIKSPLTDDFTVTHGALDKDNRYIYDPFSKNIISSTQINSLYFKVPISSVFQPASQSQLSYKILKNNHMINFSTHGIMNTDKVQFMVSFKNNHAPVSLTFYLSAVDGKVIRIPSYITGGQEVKKQYDKTSAYDRAQIDMTKAFLSFSGQKMMANNPNKQSDHYWVLDESLENPYSPSKQFSLKNYHQYSSSFYVMRTWTICAKLSGLRLNPNNFYHKKSRITSITLTQDYFKAKGQCGVLMMLLQKSPSIDQQSNDAFSPAMINDDEKEAEEAEEEALDTLSDQSQEFTDA